MLRPLLFCVVRTRKRKDIENVKALEIDGDDKFNICRLIISFICVHIFETLHYKA